MESTSQMTNLGGNQFYESGTIVHEGKSFTSGGAALWLDNAGKYRAVLYVSKASDYPGTTRQNYVAKTWDSSEQSTYCHVSQYWRNAQWWYAGKRRQVTVCFRGVWLTGTWCQDSQDFVRLRQCKNAITGQW
jgi:hypothetical protein